MTIHDHDKDGYDGGSRCNESHVGHHKKAQITKGTMDIEVERKLVFKPQKGKAFRYCMKKSTKGIKCVRAGKTCTHF